MRIVAVLCLTLAVSLILSGAECDAVIQVVREKKTGQMAVRNTSDKALIAYVLAGGTKSKDGNLGWTPVVRQPAKQGFPIR